MVISHIKDRFCNILCHFISQRHVSDIPSIKTCTDSVDMDTLYQNNVDMDAPYQNNDAQ